MKSFTAKEFSRCPAKVYEAAREDGEVEITHDRFERSFIMLNRIASTPAAHKNRIKIILGEDHLGWRDLLHILAANTEVFEGDAIKIIVRLINEKAPD